MTGATEPAEGPGRRPVLSPSRAGDFKRCPLLYRFRVVDRLPERPTRTQVRGTLVHAVLERLFALPAAQRVPAAARALAAAVWDEQVQQAPALVAELFAGPADPELAPWLASVDGLLDTYFRLEDPRRIEPEARELLVETDLDSGLPLRGYVDRLDVTSEGRVRVVDYKTGPAPRPDTETRALFQMKFYALVLLHLRGVAPAELRLMYLADSEVLAWEPDAAGLRRFEGVLDAIWRAVRAAGESGDFRPNPGPSCEWCSHRAHCPAWGGTPPEYPG